jgi:hypothetical protein
MKSVAVWLVAVAMLGLVLPVNAQESDEGKNKQPTVEEAMAKLAQLGPGVHAIKKDKKGRIVSFVVVGQARISTALGKAKGIELARDKANLAASAEFVKWLKEEVKVYQMADEESVIILEGSENAEGDTLAESGKAVEKTSKRMESVSQGLVRGLQILHKEVDGDGKTYTVVKGWKADTADGVKKIAASLSADNDGKSDSGKPKPGTTSSTSKPKPQSKLDKDIESGSATSDDAKDFLP